MRFGYAKSATARGLQCHWRLPSMSDQGAVKWGARSSREVGNSCAARA